MAARDPMSIAEGVPDGHHWSQGESHGGGRLIEMRSAFEQPQLLPKTPQKLPAKLRHMDSPDSVATNPDFSALDEPFGQLLDDSFLQEDRGSKKSAYSSSKQAPTNELPPVIVAPLAPLSSGSHDGPSRASDSNRNIASRIAAARDRQRALSLSMEAGGAAPSDDDVSSHTRGLIKSLSNIETLASNIERLSSMSMDDVEESADPGIPTPPNTPLSPRRSLSYKAMIRSLRGTLSGSFSSRGRGQRAN